MVERREAREPPQLGGRFREGPQDVVSVGLRHLTLAPGRRCGASCARRRIDAPEPGHALDRAGRGAPLVTEQLDSHVGAGHVERRRPAGLLDPHGGGRVGHQLLAPPRPCSERARERIHCVGGSRRVVRCLRIHGCETNRQVEFWGNRRRAACDDTGGAGSRARRADAIIVGWIDTSLLRSRCSTSKGASRSSPGRRRDLVRPSPARSPQPAPGWPSSPVARTAWRFSLTRSAASPWAAISSTPHSSTARRSGRRRMRRSRDPRERGGRPSSAATRLSASRSTPSRRP